MPNEKYLKSVREFVTRKIVLIFDECTEWISSKSWWYTPFDKVYPDIAMFGKALGNGYAITAVVEIESNEKAKNSFISSTMWRKSWFCRCISNTKGNGENKSFNQIIKNGKYINMMWMKLSKKYSLNLRIKRFEMHYLV